MIRLLHLLGRAPDFQTERCLRALRRDAAGDHEIAVRSISPGGAYPNLFRAVVDLRRDAGAFDVIHTWDERALTAAALAGRRAVVFDAPPHRRRRALDRVRLAARHRDVQVVCSTAAQRQGLIAHGLPPERCRVIRPPVDTVDSPVARGAELRRRLGIGDDDFVLLAPGESTRPAAHERAVWAGSILHVVDERYRVLLWGRGERAEAAASLGRKLRQPGLVVVAEQALGRQVDFEDLLPAADAMLVTARGGVSPLPVATGMAAGVPVVSGPTPFIAELAGRDPALLTIAPGDSPRLLAQAVLDLRENADLRTRLVASGRAAARERFDPTVFLRQYHALYEATAAARPAGASAGVTRRASAKLPFLQWLTPRFRDTHPPIDPHLPPHPGGGPR